MVSHCTARRLVIWDYLLAFFKPPLRLDRLRPSDLPGTLYPFQIEGVKRLISNTAFLLADEMGTGKTVMTSVALRLLLQQGLVHRVLVICPKSIVSVWRRHLRDWAKPLSVVVVSKGKAARHMGWKTPAHVYVTTYDTVRNDCTNGFSVKYSQVIQRLMLAASMPSFSMKPKRSRIRPAVGRKPLR